MQFLASLIATAALASLVIALPLERRQGVTCVPKYSGILRNTYRSSMAAGSSVVAAPSNADSTLISVDGGNEAGSQFTFHKCTYVEGWGSAPEEYGLVSIANDAPTCVTASGDVSQDGGVKLYMDTCTHDTDAIVFDRQYFYANYLVDQGNAYVTLELTGGPDGTYKLPSIATFDNGRSLVVSAHPDGFSSKVLALAEVQILS